MWVSWLKVGVEEEKEKGCLSYGGACLGGCRVELMGGNEWWWS